MIDTSSYNKRKMLASYSVGALEAAITKARLGAYDYLQKRQKELVNLTRQDITLSEFRLVTTKELLNGTLYTYKLPSKHQFVTGKARARFLKSALNNVPISPSMAFANKDLLPRSFMMFVDGYFVDYFDVLENDTDSCIMVRVYKGTGTPPTRTIPHTLWAALLGVNAKATILTMPGTSFGVYETNRFVLQKYLDGLSLDRFNISGELATEADYLTFVRDERFLYASTIVDTDTTTTNLLRFNNDPGTAGKYVHLNIFGIADLYDIHTVNPSVRHFQITDTAHPIHPDNILPFTYDAVGNKQFAHHITPVVHYPNVVELVGKRPTDKVDAYILYVEDTHNEALKLRDELALFHQVRPNQAGDRETDIVPNLVKQYQPSTDWAYDAFPYLESLYTVPEEYKIRTLEEWVGRETNLLSLLLDEVYRRPGRIYIQCSTIALETKIRTHNRNEVTTVANQVTFSEPHYVFNFRKDAIGVWESIRTHIDGYFHILPSYFIQGINAYLYIPTRLLTSTSVIELQRLVDYSGGKWCQFTSFGSTAVIETDPSLGVTPKDLYIRPWNDWFRRDRSKYEVRYVNRDGDAVTMLLSQATNQPSKDGKFTIALVNTPDETAKYQSHEYENDYVYIGVGMKRDVVLTDGQMALHDLYHQHTVGLTDDTQRILMYDESGALIPPDARFSHIRDSIQSPFMPTIYRTGGQKFYIEFTPHSYNQVFSMPTIPSNGVIDLTDYLTKPFNLKWHDVYLNGRRLTSAQILPISPTRIIVYGVRSTKNLVILEWNMDDDVIRLTPEKSRLHPLYQLWEQDLLYRQQVRQAHGITDTITDVEPERFTIRTADRNMWEMESFHYLRTLSGEVGKPVTIDPTAIHEKVGFVVPGVLLPMDSASPHATTTGVIPLFPTTENMLHPNDIQRIMKVDTNM